MSSTETPDGKRPRGGERRSRPAGATVEESSATKNGKKGVTVASYQVGKGKPPKDKQWKKGCPSPNPKGRPKKLKPGERDLDFFLAEKVAVPTPDGTVIMTKRELGNATIANNYARGVPWAIKLVMQHDQAAAEGAPDDPLLFDEEVTRRILDEAQIEFDGPSAKRTSKL